MRIGILTLHAQINYGGVLQCVALQEVLRTLGHDVCVIDRWMGPCREELDGVFARGLGWRRVWLLAASLLWWRGLMRQLRCLRTMRFCREAYRLTPYHFYDWRNAPKDLGVDVIVCGSDQIWHCGDFGDPRPYLLEGAPLSRPQGAKVRAIAYAASFGVPSIPKGLESVFRSGLARFEKIGVREKVGVELARKIGFEATEVLDPTLLVDRGFWMALLRPAALRASRARTGRLRRVVCYFISQDIEDAYPALECFARRHKCRVDVVSTQLRPHVGTWRKKKNYVLGLFGAYSRVHLKLASGPLEFLELFAQADACITDSFHAVMFSVIFDVNCRVLKPQNDERKTQFSRLENFASHVDGAFFASDVADACASLGRSRTRYHWHDIDGERSKSMEWLSNALLGRAGE